MQPCQHLFCAKCRCFAQKRQSGVQAHVVFRKAACNRSQGGEEGDRSMFSDNGCSCESRSRPKNGPVPRHPVNGYGGAIACKRADCA